MWTTIIGAAIQLLLPALKVGLDEFFAYRRKKRAEDERGVQAEVAYKKFLQAMTDAGYLTKSADLSESYEEQGRRLDGEKEEKEKA